jgi:hypothetical protein
VPGTAAWVKRDGAGVPSRLTRRRGCAGRPLEAEPGGGRRVDEQDRWTSAGGSSSSAISWKCTSRSPNTGGYFALPILYGGRLVGKLDAMAGRKAGLRRVDAIHQDVPFGKTTSAAVREPDPGSGSLAGARCQTACISGTPHRAPARGERAPRLSRPARGGAEDHRLCQGRASGLRLS